ncbi:unnamed protein product [Alternaria alternata]
MAAETPCTACSWTPERQNAGHYQSNVKIFYNMSDRAAWSLGPKYIFKERSNKPPSFEAWNLQFLREKTTIPIPQFVLDYEENGRYFIQTERIPGDTLKTVWPTLSAVEREHIAKQTAECLLQLRELQSSRMQSLGEQPLFSAFLFRSGFGQPHGPLSSDDELWATWTPVLKNLPEKARSRLRERMPSAEPFTFTHGDMFWGNIIVKDGNLAGILDWESAGYFPVWWEFTCAGIGLGGEDRQWKDLLRKHMVQHEEGRNFWVDLYNLSVSAYPDLNERGAEVFKQLMCD